MTRVAGRQSYLKSSRGQGWGGWGGAELGFKSAPFLVTYTAMSVNTHPQGLGPECLPGPRGLQQGRISLFAALCLATAAGLAALLLLLAWPGGKSGSSAGPPLTVYCAAGIKAPV